MKANTIIQEHQIFDLTRLFGLPRYFYFTGQTISSIVPN